MGFSELVVKLFAETVVIERSLPSTHLHSSLPAASFPCTALSPGISMGFKPYGFYEACLESPKVADFAVQITAPLGLPLPSQQLFATDRGGD